jgi:hypothetical protein
MTREALQRVRFLLGEVDDVIYRDARARSGEDFAYTEEEVKLSEIIDEAQGQTTVMLEALA